MTVDPSDVTGSIVTRERTEIMRFQDKSVIITGGGGKIAKAYAMAFAKEGAKLSLPDIAGRPHGKCDPRCGRHGAHHELRCIG